MPFVDGVPKAVGSASSLTAKSRVLRIDEAVCVLQHECGYLTSAASDGPRVIGSFAATTCLIVLLRASAGGTHVGACTHLDSSGSAKQLGAMIESLVGLLPAAAALPVVEASLVGSFLTGDKDDRTSSDTVSAALAALHAAPQPVKLQSVCVLAANTRVGPSTRSAAVTCNLPVHTAAALDVASGEVFPAAFEGVDRVPFALEREAAIWLEGDSPLFMAFDGVAYRRPWLPGDGAVVPFIEGPTFADVALSLRRERGDDDGPVAVSAAGAGEGAPAATGGAATAEPASAAAAPAASAAGVASAALPTLPLRVVDDSTGVAPAARSWAVDAALAAHLLSLPNRLLLQCTSTSPDAEAPDYCDHVRACLRLALARR